MMECLAAVRNLVGESPVWHPEHQSIYWTDINGFRIYRFQIVDGRSSNWVFHEPVCAISLTSDPDWLLVALGPRLIFWKPATDQRIPFVQPEPSWPSNRLNDGAADPNGNFWVGSMRNNVGSGGEHLEVSGNTGSLFRVSPRGEVTVWDTGFGIVNTIAWSPDSTTFWTACSIRNVLYSYDYHLADSLISNRREFAAAASGENTKPGSSHNFATLRGVPDGSAVDLEGYLWNCRFGGSCILRFSPQGIVQRLVEMPVSNVTNCVFGGPALDTLYVTTASISTASSEPLAGGLFAIDQQTLGVKGLPPNRFTKI